MKFLLLSALFGLSMAVSLTGYEYQFDGCPRGDGAILNQIATGIPLQQCADMCDNDNMCIGMEVNGCDWNNADAACSGDCYHLFGTTDGLYSGGAACITDGSQKTITKTTARTEMKYLFNGCPRGGSEIRRIHNEPFSNCLSACVDDPTCGGIEINHCENFAYMPLPCTKCILFTAPQGSYSNGNCVTDGTQKAYQKVVKDDFAPDFFTNLGDGYQFEFNGCPRGDGAILNQIASGIPLQQCTDTCDNDNMCIGMEVNGCDWNNADAACSGDCYHLFGTTDGLYSGSCITDGSQKTITKTSPRTEMKYLFNGCPRGGSEIRRIHNEPFSNCLSACVDDPTCGGIEINHCENFAYMPLPCTKCILFTAPSGSYSNGNCVTDGTQKAYAKVAIDGGLSPTDAPTGAPTVSPTVVPTDSPTNSPTVVPTVAPTDSPTVAPTGAPTGSPTASHVDTATALSSYGSGSFVGVAEDSVYHCSDAHDGCLVNSLATRSKWIRVDELPYQADDSMQPFDSFTAATSDGAWSTEPGAILFRNEVDQYAQKFPASCDCQSGGKE